MDKPMESIGQILHRTNVGKLSPTPLNSLDQRIIEMESHEQSEQDKLWSRLNVSSLSHTFETYKVTDKNRNAYQAILNLTLKENKKKFALLYGVPGNGKTHLIEAFVIARQTRYFTMSQIMRQLKQSIRNNNYDEKFKMFCETTTLVIDDYGMGVQETNFEIADIEDIINERYHKRYHDDEKITVMATNQDIKTLPDRVVRRFRDPEFGCLVLNEETDFGKKK